MTIPYICTQSEREREVEVEAQRETDRQTDRQRLGGGRERESVKEEEKFRDTDKERGWERASERQWKNKEKEKAKEWQRQREIEKEITCVQIISHQQKMTPWLSEYSSWSNHMFHCITEEHQLMGLIQTEKYSFAIILVNRGTLVKTLYFEENN